jgi:hypothetical protein
MVSIEIAQDADVVGFAASLARPLHLSFLEIDEKFQTNTIPHQTNHWLDGLDGAELTLPPIKGSRLGCTRKDSTCMNPAEPGRILRESTFLSRTPIPVRIV